MSHIHIGNALKYRNLLIVIKQTAYEEYKSLKMRGQAPKALRWQRLESRFKTHKQCVNDLLDILRKHDVHFYCVNRVELDRQHLADVDLLVAVGGDGTVLSAAHFLDHGTIPLLGVNSDPFRSKEDHSVKTKSDERRSHGALCMCTSVTMAERIPAVLDGSNTNISSRTRIHCTVKSTFSETRLVPALNDLLIANPSPAAVSRFRMGWLRDSHRHPHENGDGHGHVSGNDNANNGNGAGGMSQNSSLYGTITRFGGLPYDVMNSLNIWSSGMWVSTATGSTAAMAAAGGKIMPLGCTDLQYLIREHMIEETASSSSSVELKREDDHHDHDDENDDVSSVNNGMVSPCQKMHLRWNSHKGRIFIDGSHLIHNLELGDEILIDNNAPPLRIFAR